MKKRGLIAKTTGIHWHVTQKALPDSEHRNRIINPSEPSRTRTHFRAQKVLILSKLFGERSSKIRKC